MDPLEKVANLLRLRGRLEAPAFSFLNLGLLAYVGQQEALAQVQTGSIKVKDVCFLIWLDARLPMFTFFLLQRTAWGLLFARGELAVALRVPRQAGAMYSRRATSVSRFKLSRLTNTSPQRQVSTRNRILVLFDWMKTRVFGRDISRW